MEGRAAATGSLVAAVRRRAWLLLVSAAILVWSAGSTAASAADVSAEEFARIAAEAESTGTVDQLAAVTSIDGKPVDLASLIDASPREQGARIAALARISAATPGGLDSATLRDQARDITSKPPFAAEEAANSGILSRVVTFIADALNTSGARGLGLIVIVGVAFAVGYVILDRVVARRQAVAAAPGPAKHPVDYRAEADTAAAAGDYAGALRMLFMDGAQHLEQLRVVRNAATTSTATVRPLAESPRFLDRFDAVAYGGDTALSDDVTEARRSWEALQKRLQTQ